MMKNKVYVFFTYPRELGRTGEMLSKELLLKIGRADLAKKPKLLRTYILEYYEDDPMLDLVRAELKWLKENKHFGFSERIERIYTKREIMTAKLLWLAFEIAPKGKGGPLYGTQYDLSKACSNCGAGAVQISPLYLKPSGIKYGKKAFPTYSGEILFYPDLCQDLLNSGLRGFHFGKVLSYKTHKPLPWMQLNTDFELPRMSDETKGFIRVDKESEAPCPVCDRDSRIFTNKEPQEYHYLSDDLDVEKIPHISHTYERITKSRIGDPFETSYLHRLCISLNPM